MANLFLAPTANYVQTTLNGGINDSVQTITLNSTSNLLSPGYVVINRQDAQGTNTPNAREVVYYTGISGSDLTGCQRGADNSTARSHSNGALVETMPTVGMWNSLTSVVATISTADGVLKAVVSPVSITRAQITQMNVQSIASITQAHITNSYGTNATITNSLSVSNASVVGLGLTAPVFVFVGSLSGPTVSPQTALPLPRTGTWAYANVITRTVASGASVIIDINKNGTSIFEAGTRPTITGGGTFVSTASINTKAFTQGDRLTWDLDTSAGVGLHVTDLNVIIRST